MKPQDDLDDGALVAIRHMRRLTRTLRALARSMGRSLESVKDYEDVLREIIREENAGEEWKPKDWELEP